MWWIIATVLGIPLLIFCVIAAFLSSDYEGTSPASDLKDIWELHGRRRQ